MPLGLNMNGSHHALADADYVNLVGDGITAIEINPKAIKGL